MSEELIEAFNDLSINQKRNQINRELIIISKLLETAEVSFGFNSNIGIKNYDSSVDGKLTESKMLTNLYEDICKIKKELITLLSIIQSNR